MKVIILILDLVVIGVFSWLFHEHAGPHNPIAGEYTGLAWARSGLLFLEIFIVLSYDLSSFHVNKSWKNVL